MNLWRQAYVIVATTLQTLNKSFTTYRDRQQYPSSTESGDTDRSMPGIAVSAHVSHLNANNKVFPPKPTIFIVPAPPPPPPPSLPSASSQGRIQDANSAPNQPWTQLPPPSKIQRCFQVPNTTGSLQSPMQYAFQAPLSPSSFQRPVNNRKAKPRTLSPRAVLSFRPEHYSEREMPRNENDVTMSKVLDRVIVPQYLSSNPACDDLGLACKIRYISRMRFRHAKLTVRVEKWRQGIPYELDDEKISLERIQNAISRGAARRPFGMQWLNLMKRREARERTNMTDYVNGEIDGLGRGRLMCWPVLIPIEAMDGWPLAEFDEDAAAELDKELEGFPSDF
ncbi:MAG: hypothetical protein Q9223_003250 [Gallowayella weberi]